MAATTDYVFADDAAIAQSLALNAMVLGPLAIGIMLFGLKHVRSAIEAAADWETTD